MTGSRMKRSKCDETLDPLSELPDSVILQILSLLDMRNVVRTTVLSKRWQNLWTAIPCLDFDELKKKAVETRNFVSRALLLWKGAKMQRFKVDICENGFPKLDNDIDVWMRFVAERNVEELYLHVHDCNSLYLLPQFLFSCSSFTKLSLIGCSFEVRGVVHWHHLKSLEIHAHSVSEDTINRVFSGTPRLEIFALTISSDGEENLSIRSSSLKRLSLTCFLDSSYCSGEISEHSMLIIWAPNLESLVLSGYPYSAHLMKDVSSLTDVTLDYYDDDVLDIVDIVGKTLREILPAFRRIEVITLSSWCFEELRVINDECSLSPLSNVKKLSLACDLDGPYELIDLFEIFPKLKKLDIDRKIPHSKAKQGIRELLSFEAYIFKTSMVPLRIVEIGWHVYEASIFQFVEFFLKHATMLEKIVIQKRGKEDVEYEDMIKAGEKLLSLQRSFPTVELIFCIKS